MCKTSISKFLWAFKRGPNLFYQLLASARPPMFQIHGTNGYHAFLFGPKLLEENLLLSSAPLLQACRVCCRLVLVLAAAAFRREDVSGAAGRRRGEAARNETPGRGPGRCGSRTPPLECWIGESWGCSTTPLELFLKQSRNIYISK